MSDVTYERLPVQVGGVDLSVATAHRAGGQPPIVFGSMKEDSLDIARHRAFAGRPFLAYDAPGCGETACADLSKISIPLLVETPAPCYANWTSSASASLGTPWAG